MRPTALVILLLLPACASTGGSAPGTEAAARERPAAKKTAPEKTPATTASAPATTGAAPTAAPPARLSILKRSPKIFREGWLQLPGSKATCGGFDYFPGGGIRSFYCHVNAVADYSKIQTLSGLAAFRSGPHTREALDLTSRNSFGHYDPAFVRWLVDHLIPGAKDVEFRRQTQPIYDKYVKPLARIAHVTFAKLKASPGLRDSEKKKYLAFMAKKALPAMYYEKYFFFMNPRFASRPDGNFSYFHKRGFDGGVNGNVVKTCVAFWLRRSIDGTADLFHAGVKKLLATYDPGALKP